MSQAVEPPSSSRRADPARIGEFGAQDAPAGEADFARAMEELLTPNLAAMNVRATTFAAAPLGKAPARTNEANENQPRRNRSKSGRGADNQGDSGPVANAGEAINLPDPATAAAALLVSPARGASHPKEAKLAPDDGLEPTATARERDASTARDRSSGTEDPAAVPDPSRETGESLGSESAAAPNSASSQGPGSVNRGQGENASSTVGATDGSAPSSSSRSGPASSTASSSGSVPAASATAGAGERSPARGGESVLKPLIGPAGAGTARGIPAKGSSAAEQSRTPAQPFAQSDDAIVAQLGRGLTAVLRQKGGSVLIRLAPDALGQLRVHLTLDKSQVSARFEAATPGARDLLVKSENELRAALESRGLQVKSIEVVNIGDPNRAPDSISQHERNGPRFSGGTGREGTGQHAEHGGRGPAYHHAERSPSIIGSAVGSVGPHGSGDEAGAYAADGGWLLRVDMTA